MGAGHARIPCACACMEVSPHKPRRIEADDGDASSRSGNSSLAASARSLLNGSMDNDGLLPDPEHVTHVHIDHHLHIVKRLEVAQRRSDQLSSEVERLRSSLGSTEVALRSKEADHRRTTDTGDAVTKERDRLLGECAESKRTADQAAEDALCLRRELKDAASRHEALQKRSDAGTKENAKLLAEKGRLEQSLSLQKRQLQCLQGLACAECRLKSLDMNGTREFFVEEPWKGRDASGDLRQTRIRA